MSHCIFENRNRAEMFHNTDTIPYECLLIAPEASHRTISQSETMRQSLDPHDGGVVVEQSYKL